MNQDRTVGTWAAIVMNLVGLLLVNAHPVWRPWTQGLVTDAFSRTVPVADFALVVQLVGNWALLRRPGLRSWGAPVATAVFTGTGLLSLTVFLNVYPLDLGALGMQDYDVVVQFVLGVAMFGVLVALVIQLLRAMGAVVAATTTPSSTASPTDEPPARPRRPPSFRPPAPPRRHR